MTRKSFLVPETDSMVNQTLTWMILAGRKPLCYGKLHATCQYNCDNIVCWQSKFIKQDNYSDRFAWPLQSAVLIIGTGKVFKSHYPFYQVSCGMNLENLKTKIKIEHECIKCAFKELLHVSKKLYCPHLKLSGLLFIVAWQLVDHIN